MILNFEVHLNRGGLDTLIDRLVIKFDGNATGRTEKKLAGMWSTRFRASNVSIHGRDYDALDLIPVRNRGLGIRLVVHLTFPGFVGF